MDINYNNDEIEVDILEVFQVLLKKTGLIILVGALWAFVMVGYCKVFVTPAYQSTGRILIINQREETTSDGQLTLNANLSDDYQEVIKSRTVINQVIENLNLPVAYEQLVGRVAVSVVGETRVLEITATDADSAMAKKIVDELQKVAVKQIEDFLEVYAAKIMEEGTLPQAASTPNVSKYAILAFGMGAFVTVIYLIVCFLADGTIKTEEQVKKYLHCVTLGVVSVSKKEKEAFEALRTNIKVSQENLKTLLVTNCNEKESAHAVAYELARSFAKNDRKVLFIDANLRTESENQTKAGLTELLSQKAEIVDVCVETEGKGLSVVYAGGFCHNPSELLDSQCFTDLLTKTKEEYDTIIIQTAALNKYIDAAIIAKQCDGTIIVVESGLTHYQLIQKAIKQLVFVKANILGCVIAKK